MQSVSARCSRDEVWDHAIPLTISSVIFLAQLPALGLEA